MLVRGTVLTNIPCQNEAEKKGRESVRFYSIRMLIEAVCHEGVWYTPDMFNDRPEGVNKVKPILEISYEANVPHAEDYALISDLRPKQRYEMTIASLECFYVRKGHVSKIDARGVMSMFVKCFGNSQNISFVQEIGMTQLPEGQSTVSIPSAEIITMLTWAHSETAVVEKTLSTLAS